MKKVYIKFLHVLSILCVIALTSTTVSAKQVVVESKVQQEISDEVLGEAVEVTNLEFNTSFSKAEVTTFSNLFSNRITLDWVATENSIIFYIDNFGIDAVDSVSCVIDTGNLKKSFDFYKVGIGTNTYSVSVPLKTCHESISIKYYATDGGDSIARATSYGSRDIQTGLLNKWGKGSFVSKAKCLEYHFKTHGKEVGATTISSYVRLADTFRSVTIPKQNLEPYKKVLGATANCYRYRNSYLYLDVVCVNGQPSGNLISFGSR